MFPQEAIIEARLRFPALRARSIEFFTDELGNNEQIQIFEGDWDAVAPFVRRFIIKIAIPAPPEADIRPPGGSLVSSSHSRCSDSPPPVTVSFFWFGFPPCSTSLPYCWLTS